MDSRDHNNTQHSPGGGKSRVCSKCGWNNPNPHPSAKNRRAHKKICGTIKGFEILGSDQNLDLQKEHCLDDEQKTPSPTRVLFADVSEEDVFADAVCEFSSSLVSDSIKEKEEETVAAAKCNNPGGETQQCNKSPEVVQESLDVLLPLQVLENFPTSVEVETCGADSMIEQSREAQVIHDGRAISNVGVETEYKENVADESAIGKRVDTCASSWNDAVIYSDLEGPHGSAFSVEDMNMNHTTVSDKNPVDIETIAAIPFAENAHVSLHGTKGLEDKLPTLEDKTEPHGQTSLVALPSVENIVMPKIDPGEDIKMKPEEGESSFGASQETVESETVTTSLPAVDPVVADTNADVSHSDLIAPESELTQANVVAEENSTISELSSESSCAVEHYFSPVALEGDEHSVQNKSTTETSKDSILQIGAEACESTDEEDFTTPNGSANKTTQKLVEGGSSESNRVVGGFGVIQANEIDAGNVKAHNIYAETIESSDHRDLGRLQNLSEAHIRSLVLSPLATRDNTSNNAISGHSEPENESQSSSLYVGVSKNQEITTSWSTAKEEQHVPLKNLLNEARSPRVEATKIPRVSSILEQETSPGWPERREVSEEWNSPAKYPVQRKVKGRPFWVPFVCCSSAAK